MEESAQQKVRQSRQGKTHHSHGRGPWIFVDENNAAAGGNVHRAWTVTTGKHDLHSEVIPKPVHAIAPFKLVAPDGREVLLYQPISGFEHLFTAAQDPRGNLNLSNSCLTPRISNQPRKVSASVASRQGPAQGTRCQDDRRMQKDRSRKVRLPEKKRAVHNPPNHKASKKTHPIAQGLSQPRFAPETERHLQLGDIKALKTFFRHRIDELTMKPVRGMVTGWIKQLEPRRLGGYGPYHKKLPTEAPADATPPWWPQNVPYIEPAHLDKEGLLTLAVEVMLQHRDSPTDEIKRRSPWTVKLRQIAEYNVETTPSGHFSSSKSAVFNSMMKDRAVKSILPSLFATSQSYEDFVFQHNLWKYRDEKGFPIGKSMTWQPVSRPPKQTIRRKRVRRARVTRVNCDDLDIESLGESSADDTKVDERMETRQRSVQEGQNGRTNATVDASPHMLASRCVLQPTQENASPNTSYRLSQGYNCFGQDAKAAKPLSTDDNKQQVQQRSTPTHSIPLPDIHSSGPYPALGSLDFASYPTGTYTNHSQLFMYNNSQFIPMSQLSMDPSLAGHGMAYSHSSEGLFIPPDMAANSFDGLPCTF